MNALQKVLLLSGVSIFVVSCSKIDDIDNNFVEQNSDNEILTKSLASNHLSQLEYRLSNEPIIKKLTDSQKRDFFNSVLFNNKGEVISFILDYEKMGISEDEYLMFTLNVLNVSSMKYIDEDNNETLIGNIVVPMNGFEEMVPPEGGTGNPPMIFRNKRNNNVGGCDKWPGSICVIRW